MLYLSHNARSLRNYSLTGIEALFLDRFYFESCLVYRTSDKDRTKIIRKGDKYTHPSWLTDDY